jgi:hypothetical protein
MSWPGSTSASSLTTWWQMPRPASKKWRTPCSADEAPDLRVVRRMLGGRRGHGMVERDRKPFRV